MHVEILGPYAPSGPLLLPLLLSLAECGFPSPADDYVDRALDLNDLVVKNPAATYFVRARGDSMHGAGIHDGDVLVVDRGREVEHGDVVVASINGDLTVKRVRIKTWAGRITSLRLAPENDLFPSIEVTPDMEFKVWGVVVYVLHPLTRDAAREVPIDPMRAQGDRAKGYRVQGDGQEGSPPRLQA